MSVCLSARILLMTRANFTKLSVHVACGCGSVLLWRRCNMLCKFLTYGRYGFVDDIMFSHSYNYNWSLNKYQLTKERLQMFTLRQHRTRVTISQRILKGLLRWSLTCANDE